MKPDSTAIRRGDLQAALFTTLLLVACILI